ncbi:MAG: signal peptidase II [Ruminococcaceae bacterium]|nr:signal peptidase II [Oscillospiraceae bacterium]
MKKYTKKKIIILVIQYMGMAMLIGIDLIIKKVVVDNIALYENVGFIEGLFSWTYVQNTGMAWSMFDGNPELLSVFTGILIFAALVYLAFPLKRALAYDICVPVIIAGGAANMIDRMTRGFVVDYIRTLFVDFPVYNFADCLITCGAAALMIYLIYEIVRDSKNEKKKKAEVKSLE